MNLDSFTGPGSTPSRRRFWDKVTQAVLASQKVEGKNVSVDEHQGYGSLISINPQRSKTQVVVGACCYNDGTCDDLTESDCTDAGGNWQGSGTTCDDDPNPCRGACCEGEGGTTCVDDSTPDSCAADGGTFQDFGSTCEDVDCTVGACCNEGDCSILSNADCLAAGGVFQGPGTLCDPNPCEMPPCMGCGFDAFDGSGRKFLTMTENFTRTAHSDIVPGSDGCNLSANITQVTTISTDDCSLSVVCSGTTHYENAAHPDLEFADCDNECCDGFGNCHLVLVNSAGGLDCSITTGGCADGHCGCTLGTVVSATELFCDDDFTDLHNSCSMSRSIILSDECLP